MSGAIRPATSLIGASSGSELSSLTHGLVRDGDVAGRDQRVGALPRRRQVQVREERLVRAQAPRRWNSSGERLLHLADQVGDRPQLVGVVDDLGAGAEEVGVGHGRAVARALLTRTVCPADVSSRTPGGGDATRYSSSFTSLGTPMIMGYSSMLLITCLMRV